MADYVNLNIGEDYISITFNIMRSDRGKSGMIYTPIAEYVI